jgi:hypothetical protein
VESWGDDVPAGKQTDFMRAVQAKPDEAIVFSWIEYPDKATRDAAGQKMMTDARMQAMKMPFDGAEFNGGDGGGDIAIAGQHHGAGIGALGVQRLHHFEAIAIFETQVDHRIGGGTLGDGGKAGGDGGGDAPLDATALHGTLQPLQECGVIVHQQEGRVGGEKLFDRAHGLHISVCGGNVKMQMDHGKPPAL